MDSTIGAAAFALENCKRSCDSGAEPSHNRLRCVLLIRYRRTFVGSVKIGVIVGVELTFDEVISHSAVTISYRILRCQLIINPASVRDPS